MTTNIDADRRPTLVHDFNDPLPLPDASFDAVLLIGVLHILRSPDKAAGEVFRILRSGGRWYITSPFMFHENREPEDFLRFTSMGLERMAKKAGFVVEKLISIGGHASSAENLVTHLFPTVALKAPLRLAALAFDKTVFRTLNEKHPAPVTFFLQARKP